MSVEPPCEGMLFVRHLGGVPTSSPVIPFLMPQDLEAEAVALRALKDPVTEKARLLLHLTSVSAPAAYIVL